MAYHQPFQITGFHSCDREIGLKILNGELDLKQSNNPWDWLGPGIYFWEQNPGRALEYAVDVAESRQKNSGPIKTPFVIGAIIELGNCLNLLEPNSLSIVKEAHASLEKMMSETGQVMPQNKGPVRKLDCAVIQTVHETNKREKIAPYDSIRCAFVEGSEIYPNSNFSDRLHIEICVLNPSLIRGYFLPKPIHEFNPYLRKEYSKE